MRKAWNKIEDIRAALSPHGISVRGVVHFDGDGPEMVSGAQARTVVLLGNIGGSIWPAFSAWHSKRGRDVANPLDAWSVDIIRPVAQSLGGQAYFPSEKPWQPFQQWAMRGEGLKASPLGVLIHPHYGLWHGYRGAIGFAERIGESSIPFERHPCDDCVEKPCLATCPADAVRATVFDVPACRSHIRSPAGKAGCMLSGCIARNACPIGVEHRYPLEQLQFHMAALS
jgi:hypothetical protein